MNRKPKQSWMQVLRDYCSNHGLKMTPQRVAIYEAIKGSTEHPSADKIYRKVRRSFPTMSFDTVNRTLVTFSKIGLLNVVEGYGDPKRFDPNLNKHHHFRCSHCNTIIDFYNQDFDMISIPTSLKNRFKVSSVKVLLEGICKQCRTKKG